MTLIELVSGLVLSGVPLGELVSLRALVSPNNVRTALVFMHNRAGGRVNARVEMLAYRAHKICRSLEGVPADDVEALREISAMVAKDAPRKCCLTEKNRRLVEQTEDRAFVDRLVTLPERLMQEASRLPNRRQGAVYARDAVAIELLLTCSVRLGNLIDLRIGESIKRHGQAQSARWVIDVAAEKVKNDQPLRFTLMPDSERLIEHYLREWHHCCCPGSPWLFLAAGGGYVGSAHLSNSISKRTLRYVGARVTAHQFRHLMAELYLREDPNGLGVVSQHLAHKNCNTTRRYYAREQTQLAAERYHEVLMGKRAAAIPSSRNSRHKHRILNG